VHINLLGLSLNFIGLLHSSFRDGEGDGIMPTDIRRAKIAIIRKVLARVFGMLSVP
jgi:hypothetical protein